MVTIVETLPSLMNAIRMVWIVIMIIAIIISSSIIISISSII